MSEMEKNNHPSSKQMNDAIHQRLLQLQKPCMSNSELSDDSDCIDPREICYRAKEGVLRVESRGVRVRNCIAGSSCCLLPQNQAQK